MTENEIAPGEQDGEGEAAGPSSELAALREEVAALKDQALRYAAEAENTRRRAEREINDSRAYAIQKFARDLLGVADNLSRALAHAPKDADEPLARNLAVGLEMTEKELMTAFERNGLKQIAPERGAKFDPHQHQAMSEQSSSEIAPGRIVQVLAAGYELFGRIVRPAMVVVAGRDSTGPASDEPGAAKDIADAPT